MTPQQHADAILRVVFPGVTFNDERTAILAAVTTAMEDGRAELAAENARLMGVIQAFNNGMPPMTSKDAAEEVARLRAHADELAGTLKWYADTFCEQGPYSEVCSKLSDDECSGCKARTALAKHREMK